MYYLNLVKIGIDTFEGSINVQVMAKAYNCLAGNLSCSRMFLRSHGKDTPCDAFPFPTSTQAKPYIF